MSSNDLLSYSIMHRGDKAMSPCHYAPAHFLPLPLPLPPLPMAKAHTSISKAHTPIALPPITSYRLTENNLSHLACRAHARNSTPPSLTYSSASPASSVSSVSPVSSPQLSHLHVGPDSHPSEDSHPSHEDSHVNSDSTDSVAAAAKRRRQRLGPSCDSCRSRKVKCNAEIVVLSRNLNINHDLNQFNLSLGQINDLINLHKPVALASYNSLDSPDSPTGWSLAISHLKLIKFRPCESCNSKKLPCCFSKGFTKEDIMLNNKKTLPSTPTPTPSDDSSLKKYKVLSPCPDAVAKKISKKKHASPPSAAAAALAIQSLMSSPSLPVLDKPVLEKPVLDKPDHATTSNTRKSSCGSCRKRKVKCVYNAALSKCDGCAKKGHQCSFGH